MRHTTHHLKLKRLPGRVIIALVLFNICIQASAERTAWVTAMQLNKRTCPSSSCGILGALRLRDEVTVLAEMNGWARISTYYGAGCENGVSRHVVDGNANCVPTNGIAGGELAEWVSAEFLGSSLPANPWVKASGGYGLVTNSDDYRLYKDVFAQAASSLIESGRCSPSDFKTMGGWIKSSSLSGEAAYFTYCGGMQSENKVYLDARTGKIE